MDICKDIELKYEYEHVLLVYMLQSAMRICALTCYYLNSTTTIILILIFSFLYLCIYIYLKNIFLRPF
jgi:hypothetical protein